MAAPLRTPTKIIDWPRKSRAISAPISATRLAIVSRDSNTLRSGMDHHLNTRARLQPEWLESGILSGHEIRGHVSRALCRAALRARSLTPLRSAFGTRSGSCALARRSRARLHAAREIDRSGCDLSRWNSGCLHRRWTAHGDTGTRRFRLSPSDLRG